MRMTGTDSLRRLLALGLMSGLVAALPTASIVASLPQPTATSAEGRWTGMTPTGLAIAGLVLDDGSYWLFCTATDNLTFIARLIQGTSTSHSGFFGFSNTRDFNLEGAGIRAATMHGAYTAKKSFGGTIAYATTDTESFTSTSDADAESAPNLTLVTGIYSGIRTDHHTVTVTVDLVGTLSGHSSDGCTFTGTLSPRAKDNVFHTSVTFGGSACRQGTETLTGVAFYDAITNWLYSVALNHARTTSCLFLGTKQ